MDVKNIVFEDGVVTIVYSEDHDKKSWGSQTKLIEAELVEVSSAAREFIDDCRTFIDAILMKLHE